jgi:hypothetical protein
MVRDLLVIPADRGWRPEAGRPQHLQGLPVREGLVDAEVRHKIAQHAKKLVQETVGLAPTPLHIRFEFFSWQDPSSPS